MTQKFRRQDEVYQIMICSHREQYGDGCYRHLRKHPKKVIDGAGAPSCSDVWNRAIQECEAEVCFVCNEKARPSDVSIENALKKLEEGFAVVAPYRFGFFAFRKSLIAEVGWFDERFIGGHYEDNDFVLRLREKNLACFETEEIDYLQLLSSWSHSQALLHWARKWQFSTKGPERLLEEEKYSYEMPKKEEVIYLSWESSQFLLRTPFSFQLDKYNECNFISDFGE